MRVSGKIATVVIAGFLLLGACQEISPTASEESLKIEADQQEGLLLNNVEAGSAVAIFQRGLNYSLFFIDLFKMPLQKERPRSELNKPQEWFLPFNTFGSKLKFPPLFRGTDCKEPEIKGQQYTFDFGQSGCRDKDNLFGKGRLEFVIPEDLTNLRHTNTITPSVKFSDFAFYSEDRKRMVLLNGTLSAKVVAEGPDRTLYLSAKDLTVEDNFIYGGRFTVSIDEVVKLVFNGNWDNKGAFEATINGRVNLKTKDGKVFTIEMKDVKVNPAECALNPLGGEGSVVGGGEEYSFKFHQGCDGKTDSIPLM